MKTVYINTEKQILETFSTSFCIQLHEGNDESFVCLPVNPRHRKDIIRSYSAITIKDNIDNIIRTNQVT